MLAVVLFASALFFAGLSTKMRTSGARIAVLGLGCFLFLVAVVWVATFPAASRTTHALESGSPHADALVTGFHAAFFAGAAVAAIGLVASLVLIRREDLEEPVESLGAVRLALDVAA
jgi:hypothetical protein